MNNIFLTLIRDGKIHTLDELKRTYRTLVKKTHPDAVGSTRLVNQYIEFNNQYENAKETLIPASPPHENTIGTEYKNYRLLFYREFYKLEIIDKPHPFNSQNISNEMIENVKQQAFDYFQNWKKESIELYKAAHQHYDKIKSEKPSGPYRKDDVLANLGPVFHNIISYQLTGAEFYKKQLKQNFDAIMIKLEEKKVKPLKTFIHLLIQDMEQTPAIFEIE